jgi:crotonobetainyl-CoA:carnitine CoA-transferase CaiB-like acyl-CoA transferase
MERPMTGQGNRQGPLVGMKVVELAHIMAGPACGMMLADMGADVIKVEKPDGDDSRRFLPPAINGESAAYLMMNRNKRGIALNLKDADAVAVLRSLLAQRRRGDRKLPARHHGTLGCPTRACARPIPAWSIAPSPASAAPALMQERGGFDLIAQGMSGLMSITGEGPGRPPVKPGAPISDITAGILAAMGCIAAYHHAQKTGEGQIVDTSLFEAGSPSPTGNPPSHSPPARCPCRWAPATL